MNHKFTKFLIASVILFSALIINKSQCHAIVQKMPDGNIFDADYYRIDNPDVVEEYGSDAAALYKHYLEYGKAEGRKPCFDADRYGKKPTLKNFRRIGVIGDSFASGTTSVGGELKDNYAISWPQVLARKYGVKCTNYTKGGMSTYLWSRVPEGLATLNMSEPDDLYIIVLGINDGHSTEPELGTKYLGSINDIKNKGNSSQYRDSFYGNYGRIIEQVKAHAPGSKIIIANIIAQDDIDIRFNNAISEIASYYGIPIINQSDDGYFSSSTYLKMDMGHPTKAGHAGMADAFARLINQKINENKYYFYPYVN